jgi:hypothetical protein
MAAFGSSAVIGFIFAVPRASTAGLPSKGLTPNTNLEQVSDWLTKILIGAGLVQIGSIAGEIHVLAGYLAPAFGGSPASEIFASVLIVFNLAMGFTVSYIATRLILTNELRRESVEDEYSL